jgi:uncharacterized protein with NRDE domain
MCVIYFAHKAHPGRPLILAANRDEFYSRPTAPAQFWDDHPDIYAGRDLVAGGTWLGITLSGRVSAVTNYREPGASKGHRSRGELVAEFLKGDECAEDYLAGVDHRRSEYSGFNLLVGEFSRSRCDLFYLSNRSDAGLRKLEPGIYGLSNHLLDTPWPKVRSGLERFGSLVKGPDFDSDQLFELLVDESLAEDDDLPDTGIGYEKEKALSSIFIRTPIYGTRSSTVVTLDDDFEGKLVERVFV